jgi:hypothetical protein
MRSSGDAKNRKCYVGCCGFFRATFNSPLTYASLLLTTILHHLQKEKVESAQGGGRDKRVEERTDETKRSSSEPKNDLRHLSLVADVPFIG